LAAPAGGLLLLLLLLLLILFLILIFILIFLLFETRSFFQQVPSGKGITHVLAGQRLWPPSSQGGDRGFESHLG
jgi:ABC-type phosphate transport system permease subunit